jgi:hypothetical protein
MYFFYSMCRHESDDHKLPDKYTLAILCTRCGNEVQPLRPPDQIVLTEKPLEYWPSYFRFLSSTAKKGAGFANDTFFFFLELRKLLSSSPFSNEQLATFSLMMILETNKETYIIEDFDSPPLSADAYAKMNELLRPLMRIDERHFIGRYCQAMSLTALDELRLRSSSLSVSVLSSYQTAETRAATMLYVYLQRNKADASQPNLKLALRLQHACRLPQPDDFAIILLQARTLLSAHPGLFVFEDYPDFF